MVGWVRVSPEGEFIFFGRSKKTNQKKVAPQLVPAVCDGRDALRASAASGARANSLPLVAQTCTRSFPLAAAVLGGAERGLSKSWSRFAMVVFPNERAVT